MSAWIETRFEKQTQETYPVALLVSAWIETHSKSWVPSAHFVALLVSAWIETAVSDDVYKLLLSRTPRECVD